MKPTQKDLIDTDGENRAVRAFLLGREVGCKDYEQMRRHMTNSGFDNCWPSEFSSLGGHMSKAAQQMWLRHLFALERFGAGGGEPFAKVESALAYCTGFHARLIPGSRMPKVGTVLYTHPSPTDLSAEYLRGLGDAKAACQHAAYKLGNELMVAHCAEAIEALKGKQ